MRGLVEVKVNYMLRKIKKTFILIFTYNYLVIKILFLVKLYPTEITNNIDQHREGRCHLKFSMYQTVHSV